MKEALTYLKQDRVLKLAFIGSSIFLLSQLVVLLLSFASLPPLVPLYLQRPWGVTQIALKSQLLIIPAITASLLIINTFLSVFFYKDSPLAARILLWGQALVAFLSAISIIKITFLVI